MRTCTHPPHSLPGTLAPPISEDEIRYVCGKSLLNGIDGRYERDKGREGTSVSMTLNKRAEWAEYCKHVSEWEVERYLRQFG